MVTDHQLKQKPFHLSNEDISWVHSTLSSMTEEEKIGQLFCLAAFTTEQAFVDHMFRIMKPGGIMYRPMPSAEAVQLTHALRAQSAVPMLIAANLEAGANGAVADGTYLGNEMQVAATGDVETARRLGVICAEEAGPSGFNWAFAPIIDIDMNFRNPITNTRTFGSDPMLVAAMGEAYVKAVEERGMASSIKHFPGDGHDERDQHLVTSINGLDCQTWDETYGHAYRTCIEAGAKTVMVGHIIHPAYIRHFSPTIRDEDMLPATLSPELMQGLLRGKLGFNGLIVTDATMMGGFTIAMSRKKAVPLSIAAGADMFLFCKDMQEDFNYMKAGVREGVITKERLDEAVTRILALKASLKLHEKPLPGENRAKACLKKPEHLAWSRECADKAVTLVKEQKGILPFCAAKTPRLLLHPIEQSDPNALFHFTQTAADRFKRLLEAEGFEVSVFEASMGREGMMAPCATTIEKYDLIVYLCNLATKSNQTVVRIEWAQPMGANLPIYLNDIPTVFISIANPYHLIDVPRVKTYINAYNADDAVLSAVIEKLMGRSAFLGKSPVDAFCGKWDTKL